MGDPMSVMSLDVLVAILRCGPPGYLGLIGLFGGSLLFGSGVLLLMWLIPEGAAYLWKALRLTLGI